MPRQLCVLATMVLLVGVASQAAVAQPPVRKEGVCFVLYTVEGQVLKMTAQLYPLGETDSRRVFLEVKEGAAWSRVAESRVRENPYSYPEDAKSWTAHFRLALWDPNRDQEFRVVCLEGANVYEGTIRRDPVEKDEIVVAAFSCNSNADKRLKPDLVQAVEAIDADLLFFAGDQVYTHRDHLGDWLRFGEQFGDVTRDRPAVVITDDHDVGQGNLWGAGGRLTKWDRQGGYVMPASHVKEVEWAQTSHLPDPYDPTPVEQGIGVYYTRLHVGGIDFAILEDRKFKSGPDSVLPRDVTKGKNREKFRDEPQRLDPPKAVLLGERQLDFLEDWAGDWRGADMKCVLSQTPFAAAHTNKAIDGPTAPSMDFDTNGWPRSGRQRALQVIRKASAFHLCGDQHLATVLHYGVDDWNDAGYTFVTPAIVNFYPRVWRPNVEPQARLDSPLPFAGSYFDAFGNRMTVHAYANPEFGIPNYQYQVDDDAPLRGADGFGVVRFDKATRKITMECWPRLSDITKPEARQYEGWPITINQFDNDGRTPQAWLPEVRVAGLENPVVQVVSEADNRVVYTRRIRGQAFQPPVFADGTYTLRVGEQPDRMQTAKGLKPSPLSEPTPVVELSF